jgi:hypothetical protein
MHQYSASYDITIRPDQAPPHAGDDIHYSITILDRKTRQPHRKRRRPAVRGQAVIDRGMCRPGRSPRPTTASPTVREVGVYHAKLNFVIPGTLGGRDSGSVAIRSTR